ncbi:hypothetical protein [Arenimonas oryziterrae]|uniref:Uncharacterized protein n=1 Tax=Arenimonas oryziterrae DSM 21050 = YC6267 TaxID=1121015 RepID=A0A091AUZ1_9GAMM|nr:hypothetical protein [Arenimonas oryziterrae]KFN43077.1 hypothetical protein N789_10975 [Arenimonas oryziterrae DSM 21050 = YC6267]
MQFEYLIPISFFICVTVAIKAIVDARVRRRMVETNTNDELIKSMLLADEQSRRLSALKWGLVLVLQALAFAVIDAMNLSEPTPGAFALILGAAGVGLLGYHFVAKRLG